LPLTQENSASRTAKKLVRAFGEKVFYIIESNPNRLRGAVAGVVGN